MTAHASETPRNLQAEIQPLCCFPLLKQQKQKDNYTQKQKEYKKYLQMPNLYFKRIYFIVLFNYVEFGLCKTYFSESEI